MAHFRAELERRVREQIERRLDGVRERVERETKDAAPKDEGTLYASISAATFAPDGLARYRGSITATAPHASYTDEGTGIYGPWGTRITARAGGVLVFFWKYGPRGSDNYAYRSVAGQPAQRWFAEPMPTRYADAVAAEFG